MASTEAPVMDVRTATPAPAIDTHAAAGAVIRMPAAPTVMNEGSDASGASMDSSMGRSLPEQSREASSESVVATHQPAPNQQRRIPDQEVALATAVPSSVLSSSRHMDALGQSLQSPQHPAAIPQLLYLIQRFRNVFLSGEDGPVVSTDGGVASTATIELVLAVRDAVAELWRTHEAEIKRRCAPSMPQGLLAKQEVFGFALADALGRPRLPGERAMKVGQNGDNAVRWAEGSKDRKGKLPTARETAASDVRKARRAADKDPALQQGIKDAEEKGQKAVAAVLSKSVDLDLPNETVGAKRKHAAVANPPVRPTLEALRAAAARAQAAVEAAKAVETADRRRWERAQRKVDDIKPPHYTTPSPPPSPPDSEDIEVLKAWYANESNQKAADAYVTACERADAKHDAAMAKFDAAVERAQASADAVHAELVASAKAVREAKMALNKAEDAVREREWEQEAAREAELEAEREATMASMAALLHAYKERVFELEESCGALETTVHVLLEKLRTFDPQQHGPALCVWEHGAARSDEESDGGWNDEQVALANEEMRRTSGPVGQRL